MRQSSIASVKVTPPELSTTLPRLEETSPSIGFRNMTSRAGGHLMQFGELDALIEHMARAGDWEFLVCLISQHAMRLLAEGHLKDLRRWIDRVPDEVSLNDPWLAFWSGTLSVGQDSAAARALLEPVWDRFEERGDRMGLTLTAAAILETYQFEWSSFGGAHRWIDRLESCLGSDCAFPSREAELRVYANLLVGLASMRSSFDASSPCVARLQALLDSDIHVNHRLFAGRSLLLAAAARLDAVSAQDTARRLRTMLLEQGCSPGARISTINAIAHALWLNCAYGEAESALREACDIGKLYRLQEPDPLYHQTRHLLAFARRDRNEMAECVHALRRETTSTSPLGMTMLAHALAQQAQLRGDVPAAAGQWNTAVARADEAHALPLQRITRLALSACRAAQGDFTGAAELLQQAAALSSDPLPTNLLRDYELLAAYIALRRADHHECHRLLAIALATVPLSGAASQLFALIPTAMAELCMEAVRAGITLDSVRSLIEHYRLSPPAAANRDWPWPFTVCVFGSFRLLKGDAPIRFSRRMQKKTLELLQALIAFGGTEVGAGTLIDALWPDSDGDAGYHALESALYRLRLLLGAPAAVTMAGSKLSLDRRYFWVDMWAFERELQASAASGDAAGRFARIRELYHGHFLEQESEKPWALKTRQVLRDKFLRSIRDAARSYEGQRQWREAANVYQAGIELDGMAEDLYRGLMICHRELGDHSEVLQVYRSCRELLSKVLGVQPNPKTQAIYHSVRQNWVAEPG